MNRAPLYGLFIVFVLARSAAAQAPTGTIVGLITDVSGAAMLGVRIDVINEQTDQARLVNVSLEGRYVADLLPPGGYRISAELVGFKRVERTATVEAGTTTTVDLILEVGELNETVTVRGAEPLLRQDHHQVAGVVHRDQIDDLPLNGRNFLELAKLEPGVTNPSRLGDNRTFVSFLGGGLQTVPRVGYSRVTVDGASIITPGTVGVLFQVSQDVVQEFQLATVNFDQATSLTSNGSINIVTRSGGNAHHGSGFGFYRDHHLAAYPGLTRDPTNPNPLFRRGQFGGEMGGPIRTDRVFFFGSYERHDQRGVGSVQPRAPEFAPLGGIFSAPYVGNQFSIRSDVRLTPSHNAFARYTHDNNRLFAPAATLPSGWFRRTNRVGQSLAALTSVLSSQVVNDVRFSYFFFETLQARATAEDCPGCFGLGAPRITIDGIGLTLGNADDTSFGGHRYELTESLVWQNGNHRVRFGFDWEHVTNTASADPELAVLTLWAPGRVRQLDPTIPLPTSFATVEDILQLPLQNVVFNVGSGDNLWRDFRSHRVADLYRLYVSDTWSLGRRLTVNAGLSWSYEPNALNHDLTRPALLIPILGADNLSAPAAQTATFSPTLGFAWTATADGKTVVRGGAGRYVDPAVSTNFNNVSNERFVLGPLGTGRVAVQGSSVPCDGGPFEFRQQPTRVTGAQLLAMLPALRDCLASTRNPDNRDFTLRNLDLTKAGSNVYDSAYQLPYAIHLNLGVQRELPSGMVVSADLVWKRFIHTFINGIDYNRWGSAGGPVIPACVGSQRTDVTATCSNGSIYFDTTIGRARYAGLLVRAEQRLRGRAQILASYALGSYVGSNGTGVATAEAPGMRVFGFNNDNWFENYGPLPTDRRHVLNVSGSVELPWRFQVAFSVSAYSRTPFAPYVNGVDFNGDGTLNDLLPGTTVNQFGPELDEADLARLVERYNNELAGKRTAGGQTAPSLTLPETYAFDDNFFTQDVRVTRTITVGAQPTRLLLFAEVFNLFNTANLVSYSSNLAADGGAFGQPGARFSQVFGSGGPRAFQFGAKVSF